VGETGSLLRTEPFSYTALGHEFRNYWWLSQLAFYGLFTLGGPLLLTVFAGSCAFAAVYGSWRLMRGAWDIRLTLLLFLMMGTAPEWAVRPQVISLAFMVLSAFLIVKDRSGWLPVLCVVWANTHRKWCSASLSPARQRSRLSSGREHARREMCSSRRGCMAALMVAPDGWHYWAEAVKTVLDVSSRGVTRSIALPLTPAAFRSGLLRARWSS
jgi:hypothetical protein